MQQAAAQEVLEGQGTCTAMAWPKAARPERIRSSGSGSQGIRSARCCGPTHLTVSAVCSSSQGSTQQ
jgi:hypothetical protein